MSIANLSQPMFEIQCVRNVLYVRNSVFAFEGTLRLKEMLSVGRYFQYSSWISAILEERLSNSGYFNFRKIEISSNLTASPSAYVKYGV